MMAHFKIFIRKAFFQTFRYLHGSLFGPRREKTCLRGFPKKRVSNQSPQLQRLARKLKFNL